MKLFPAVVRRNSKVIKSGLSSSSGSGLRRAWFTPQTWCAREDLNLHPFRDQILSLARLPFRHARIRNNLRPAPRNLKPGFAGGAPVLP